MCQAPNQTLGPNPAPKELAVWKREENKLVLPWAWAQPATHRALVIVGTTEVRSRREDLHEEASAELEQRRQPRDQGAMLW